MHEHDTGQRAPAAAARTRRGAPIDPHTAHAAGTGRLLDPAGILQLQRLAGNDAVGGLVDELPPSPVLEVLGAGRGQPLESGLRREMEARLGSDFSDVRLHTDAAATESARSVGAHAYTVGSDVVFQRESYEPSSIAGRTMLAHELSHVVQQRSGPVEGTDTGAGIRVSDPADRFEREATARAEAAMALPIGAGLRAGDREPGSALQREAAKVEDTET